MPFYFCETKLPSEIALKHGQEQDSFPGLLLNFTVHQIHSTISTGSLFFPVVFRRHESQALLAHEHFSTPLLREQSKEDVSFWGSSS